MIGWRDGGPRLRPPESGWTACIRILGLLLCFGGAALSAQAAAPAPPPKPKASLKRHRWPGEGEPQVEQARRCILGREAGGHYDAVDPTEQWFGAYQFQQETSDTAARRMKRPDLVGVPAHRWSKAEQDAAFYLIYDRGRGKQHWSGGRYPCF